MAAGVQCDVNSRESNSLLLPPTPGSSPVEVYFSNPDLLWANEHPRPRFGQGAFAAALDALHRQTSGSPIANAQFFGKPNPEPYRCTTGRFGCLAKRRLPYGTTASLSLSFDPQNVPPPPPYPPRLAERLLARQAVKLGIAPPSALAATDDDGAHGSNQPSPSSPSPSSSSAASVAAEAEPTPQSAAALFQAAGIYAVGDNPAADVRGANTAGAPWVSVLVRTGVFSGDRDGGGGGGSGSGGNSATDPAHLVVDDVLGAVQAALHRARSTKWHAMR